MQKVTLMYLRRDDCVLLAMKKRGFGVGKWNAPGGKTEQGETTKAAAIRECHEEVGVTPLNPQLIGDIRFYMPHEPGFDGHHIFIYSATQWQGEPHETEEMRPQWFNVQTLPFAHMWPADRRWLPDALAAKNVYFKGSITQGPNDSILQYEIDT